MMRSLYAGVTGLKTHQTKMDVIGNNIANVNTVAYKSSSITFNELMYQTTQRASGPNAATGRAGVNARQIGLGVKTGAINTNIAGQGASQTTGNPFDMKINGDAFFIVSGGGGVNSFTRDGSFYVDAAGNLAMQSNGYNVMGWQPDPNDPTIIKQDSVSALKIMSEANMTYPPAATTDAYFAGIIDRNDPALSAVSGKVTNLKFYDEAGYSYTAKISFHATATNGEYYMQLDDVLDSTGKSVKELYSAADLDDIVSMGTQQAVAVKEPKAVASYKDAAGNTVTTTYSFDDTVNPPTGTYKTTIKDSAGTAVGTQPQDVVITYANPPVPVDAFAGGAMPLARMQEIYGPAAVANATKGNLDPKTGNLIITEKNVTGGIIKFTEKGEFVSVNGDPESITLDFQDSVGGAGASLGNFKDVKIDMSGISWYDNEGVSTIAATSGTPKGLGDGRKVGALSGITIQPDGMIYASYDNNQTRLLGQVAVANFSNPSGLEKSGDNLYAATMNSGQFDGVGSDITADGTSYISTGVLEMSNVDLSSEFTEMITTQRGFQANSRIITVSDTLLEELTNLKR